MKKLDRITVIVAMLGGMGLGLMIGNSSRIPGDFFVFVGAGLTVLSICLLCIMYYQKKKLRE